MRKIIITVIVMSLITGCSPKTVNDENVESTEALQNDVEVVEEPIPEEISDPVKEVIDPNGTYYSDDEPVPCLIRNDIRVRNAPNGEMVTWYYTNDGSHYAPVKCYRAEETYKDDKYTWVKVADLIDDIWFAASPDWTEYIVPSKDTNRYSLNERAEYVETGFYNAKSGKPLDLSQFSASSYEDIYSIYPMDKETYNLCLFLNKAIPGICWMIKDVVDFDARNPSEEAKVRITWQIYFYGPVTYAKGMYPLIGDNNACVTLKEHSDYYTEKIYGNVINLQTEQYYDPKNQVYALFSILNGHGSYIPFPIVTEKEQNGEYLTVQVALIEYESLLMYNDKRYLVDSENNKDLRGIDTKDYIENKAKKCECVLRITEDGNYQLITVKLK